MPIVQGGSELNGEGVYRKKTIVTASYTTDAAALRPLRSDPTYAFNAPFKVGCGYAAHHVGSEGGIEVVRLSDGHAWNIGAKEYQSVGRVVGITCDEVFLELLSVAYDDAEYPFTSSYARVRLSSLGPGTPSDLSLPKQ